MATSVVEPGPKTLDELQWQQIASMHLMRARKEAAAKEASGGRAHGKPVEEQRGARRRAIRAAMQTILPGYWAHEIGPNRAERRFGAQLVAHAAKRGTNKQPRSVRNERGVLARRVAA